MPGEHLDCEIPIGLAVYNGSINATKIEFEGMFLERFLLALYLE